MECVFLTHLHMCVLSHSVISYCLWPHGLKPFRLLCPWDFPGKDTRMGCHFLPQGIFLTQGSNMCLLHLLHWHANSLPLSHQGNPYTTCALSQDAEKWSMYIVYPTAETSPWNWSLAFCLYIWLPLWDFKMRITADGDCSHEITRRLLLGRKAMTNLNSALKSRDITLPPKVHIVKAMVFPVVTHGCERWTIKKAECQRIDTFKVWCWRGLMRVPWTARKSNQSIWR